MRKKNLFATRALSVVSALAVTSSVLLGGSVSVLAEETSSACGVTFPLEEKVTLTVFVNATGTGGGTYTDNYVSDWIEEKTNVHLEFLYDLDGDDAKTRLNLIMTDPASQPDIYLATNWTKSEVQSYGEQGLILALNEYLEDAPNWNHLNEVCPMRKADLTVGDGNIYTFGDVNECYHCLYQNRMWIYMPWVEQLNDGKVPETTDELYEYLTKVKTQDPNGNGIADEIPMTGFVGGWSTDPTVWLINSFVQCVNPLSNTNPVIGAGLVVNDGKIEYSVMKDEYKEAVRYINTLYKEGLLDNQTFTQDGTQYVSILDNEDAHLVALHAGGAINADGAHMLVGEDGDWQNWRALEPVAGPDGVRLAAKGVTNYFASAQGIVSAQCENPEIAVALFDFLATEEATLVQSFGPEGYNWQWTSEGTALNGGTPTYETLKTADDFDWVAHGFKDYEDRHGQWASDASIKANTALFRGQMRITDPERNNEYVLQDAAERYSQYAPADDQLVPNLVFEGRDAQIISEGTLTIGGYVNQALVQFITGDMDIDKDWDTYISKLEDMGVEEYLGIYQTYYDAYVENMSK